MGQGQTRAGCWPPWTVVDALADGVPHDPAGRRSWSRASRRPSGPLGSARLSAPAARSAWPCRSSGASPRWPCFAVRWTTSARGTAGWSRSSGSRASASRGWSRSCSPAADDVLVARATAEEYESSTAYFPFRRLLRDVAGRPGGRTRRTRWPAGWSTGSSANAPHLRAWLPLLGIPMDVELEPDPGHPGARRAVPQGPARGRRQRLPVLGAAHARPCSCSRTRT